MRVLDDAAGALSGIERTPSEAGVDFLRRGVLDASLPGSVAANVAALVSHAQHVRDLMSVDTWSVLARLEAALVDGPGADDELQPLLEDVLASLLAYAGIMAQSMVRDSSWAFLDAGGRLERAIRTTALLRHTMLPEQPGEVADIVAESVLRACESIITHRRRAAAGQGPVEATGSALTLLVQDQSNPRSVAHQLAALASDLRLVGDEALAAQGDTLLRRLDGLPLTDPASWLDGLAADLAGYDDRIAARHFVRQATRHSAEQVRTSWTQEAL